MSEIQILITNSIYLSQITKENLQILILFKPTFKLL